MHRRLESFGSPHGPLDSIHQLLVEGDDDRIRVDPITGVNRYLCPPAPDPELAAFGSSTASTISAAGWAAAEALVGRLAADLARSSAEAAYERQAEGLRGELLQLLGLEGRRGVEVVLAASGTDSHRLAAGLVGSGATRPLLAIVGEPAETGGGVPAALSGSDDLSAEVVSVAARRADGGLRDEAAVDAEVEAHAVGAVREGRRVLVVVTDVSKTGLISPSLQIARELARRFPVWVSVLVDACQLRLTPAALAAYTDLGWMVAITGSKFLTGPAFSGALLVPRKLADRLKTRPLPAGARMSSTAGDWPLGWTAAETLGRGGDFGLLVRWEAALAELRRFSLLAPKDVCAFLERFGSVVRDELEAQPALEPVAGRPPARETAAGGWDAAPSIFPFLLRRCGPEPRFLTEEETQRVYRLLREDLSGPARDLGGDVLPIGAGLRVEIGQPVACGVREGAPVFALRLCASARLAADACLESSAEPIGRRAQLALAKAAWLAQEVSSGRL